MKRLLMLILFVALIIGTWLILQKQPPHIPSPVSETSRVKYRISDAEIYAYLASSTFAEPHFDGVSFFTYERLAEVATSTREVEYLWLMTQEYAKKMGTYQKVAGISIPIAIYFDNHEPVAINAPRDGSLYESDLTTIFPADIAATSSMKDTAVHNELIARLSSSLKTQAEKELGINVEIPLSPESAASSTQSEATTTEE